MPSVTRLTLIQDEWFSEKVDEIQSYTNSHNRKHFYDALKAAYGPISSGSSPMLSADRQGQILGRLAEHFNNVLNHLPPSMMGP